MKRFEIILPCLFVALSGCESTGGGTTGGGAGGTGGGSGLSTSTGGQVDVSGYAFNSIDYQVQSGAGVFDTGSNTVNILSLDGTTDSSQMVVSLGGGGTGTITDLGLTYVWQFMADPAGGQPIRGIFGEGTSASDLPSGTAGYSGISIVQIFDGSNVYDLSGDASISVDFGGNRLSVTQDDLDGTRGDGVTAQTSVTDVATITISDAVISGAGFSGGSAHVQSTELAAFLSGLETVSVSGGFFGPNAEEVGGVAVIDDTGNTVGRLLIFSSFAAN